VGESHVSYQSQKGDIYVREKVEFYKLFNEVDSSKDLIFKFKNINKDTKE
jgi:hypothetical protein